MARIDDLIELVSDDELKARLHQEAARLSANKQYGLVWENKTEKVATDCEKYLPVLRERKDLAIHTSDDSSGNDFLILLCGQSDCLLVHDSLQE